MSVVAHLTYVKKVHLVVPGKEMTMRILALVLLNLTLWTLPAQAQSWSGIINPSRAIDWSQAGVPGGIPTTRTNCVTAECVALAPGGTGTVSTATINAAIAGAPANTVVRIRAGTFTVSGGLTLAKDNVTLRGAGPDQTILNVTGTVSCLGYTVNVCMGTGTFSTLGVGANGVWSTNWSGPYTKGTTVLTVGSTASMAAGRIIVLDELGDTTDTGGILQADSGVFCQDCNAVFGRLVSGEGGARRPQHQIVKVVSVDDSTHVTVTPGLYMPNWRSGKTPQVWGWGTTNNSTVFGAGIEDLTLNATADPGFHANILFAQAYGGWIKNVRSIMANRAHVMMIQAAHIEIRDCYFYGAVSHTADSYGVNAIYGGDFLIINNIVHNPTAPFLGQSHGSVYAYNYSFDNEFYTDNTWAGLWGTHYSGGGMTLAEGNQTTGFIADVSSGTSPLWTLFRNHFNGWDDCHIGSLCRDGTQKSNYRQAVVIQSWSRAYNVVGNVLGTDGLSMPYQTTSTPGPAAYIYSLGNSPAGSDAIATSSLLRWGNYDTTNDATRWLASEIPTTGITYVNGNPVPATQTLPNSFFLSGQPSFWVTPWGTPAWPPIGPDVTGGNVSGLAGHVHDIPAKRCFNNMTNDPAYPSSNPRIKLYNATACYGGSPPSSDSTAPLPPQNVTAR